MLDSLIRIIKRPPMGNTRPGRVEIAAAALMVEMARLDGSIDGAKRDAIAEIVRGRFLLSPPAAEALVALAERREEAVYSDWIFAETIKSAFDSEERRKLLRHIHLVAMTDGVLSKGEADLITRLAAALDLTPEDVATATKPAAETPKRRR